MWLFLQYTVTEPRKQAYADFYKQYDSVKEFNAMKEAGIFESVRPSGEWNQWVFSQDHLQTIYKNVVTKILTLNRILTVLFSVSRLFFQTIHSWSEDDCPFLPLDAVYWSGVKFNMHFCSSK